MSNCKSFNAEIVWVKSKKTGIPMPLDEKVISIVTDEGEVVNGRISHYATCPQSKTWRKNVREKD